MLIGLLLIVVGIVGFIVNTAGGQSLIGYFIVKMIAAAFIITGIVLILVRLGVHHRLGM